MSRRDYIGASEVAALLAHPHHPGCCLSPYATPADVWKRKLGLVGDTPPNLAMRLGTVAEGAIIEQAADDGLLPQGFTRGPLLHEPPLRAGRVGAHPDVLTAEGLPVDVKTVTRSSPAWRGAVPAHYVAQLAAQLVCCGFPAGGRAGLLSLHLTGHGPILRLDWLDIGAEWCAIVAHAAESFFAHYILPRVRPEHRALSGEDAPWPLPPGAGEREATPEELSLLAELRALSDAEDRKETLRQALAASMSNATAITDAQGERLASYAESTRADLDRDLLPPELVAQATITRPTRTLRVGNPKRGRR